MTFVGKIISGGQTGADRAGLDAAMELGLPHGGHVPKGRLAEDGSVPPVYQLVETIDNDYRTRTKLNVDNADITLLFTMGGVLDGGTLFTKNYCAEQKKPWAHLAFGILNPWEGDIEHARWLRDKLADFAGRLGRPVVINVAGNRESKSPGIHGRVQRVIYLALEENGELESWEKEDINGEDRHLED